MKSEVQEIHNREQKNFPYLINNRRDFLRTRKQCAKRWKSGMQELWDYVRYSLSQNPNIILTVPDISEFIWFPEKQTIVAKILDREHEDIAWLDHLDVIKEVMNIDMLRDKILAVYEQSPWRVQIVRDELKEIFSLDYFREHLVREPKFSSRAVEELFLLFNGYKSPDSFGYQFQNYFEMKYKNSEEAGVDLIGRDEPWFACGGMERNYLSAITQEKAGICKVNDFLLAKYFHRKWEAKKVSYLSTEDRKTRNGYIVYKDYLYAPKGDQYQQIIDAIEAWEREMYMPDLQIKAVRPVNIPKHLSLEMPFSEFLKQKFDTQNTDR